MLIKFKNTLPGFHRNIYFSAAHYDILRLLNINHLKSFSRTPAVVYYGATSALLGPSSKSKKKSIPKNQMEMELSNFNIKKFLIFSYISGNGNPLPLPPPLSPTKNPYISWNGNLLIFPEMKPYTFQPKLENASYCRKCKPKRISYSFSKKSCSYILGNGNPKKLCYISGNRTFLYFRKLLIFQEVTFQVWKVKRTHS